MTVNKWSQTANSNDTIDSTINFKEQQSPGSLNNSSRAIMAAIAKFRDDISGKLNTAGTSTAYTITTNQGFASLTDGLFVVARVHVESGENPTLAIDGLTAKSIRIATGVAVPEGRMPAGGMFQFTYDSGDDCIYADGALSDVEIPEGEVEIPSGTPMLFFSAAAPTGWTKSTTHDNKAIRLVSGTGGATGGSSTFTSVFASRTPSGIVGNTALTISQMPLHGHPVRMSVAGDDLDTSGGLTLDLGNPINYSPYTGTPTNTVGTQIGGTGGGGSHTHSFTGDAMDFSVAYVDAIICTRDA